MKKLLILGTCLLLLAGCNSEKDEVYLCNYEYKDNVFTHNVEIIIDYEDEVVTNIKSTTSYTSDDEELKKQFSELLLEYKEVSNNEVKYTTEIKDNTYKFTSVTDVNENTIDSFDNSVSGGVTSSSDSKSPVVDGKLSLPLYIKQLENIQFTCKKETN